MHAENEQTTITHIHMDKLKNKIEKADWKLIEKANHWSIRYIMASFI